MPETTESQPDVVVLDVNPDTVPLKKRKNRKVSVGVKRARRTKAQTQVTVQEMTSIKRIARERKQRAADVVRDAISAYLKKHDG